MKTAAAILLLHQADRDGKTWYEVWVTCDAHAKDDMRSILVHTTNKRVIKREVEARLGILVPLRRVRWIERRGLSAGRFESGPTNNELRGYGTSPVVSIFDMVQHRA